MVSDQRRDCTTFSLKFPSYTCISQELLHIGDIIMYNKISHVNPTLGQTDIKRLPTRVYPYNIFQ